MGMQGKARSEKVGKVRLRIVADARMFGSPGKIRTCHSSVNSRSGKKLLSATSGVAYGTLRPFTLPLNWTEIGRK